MLDIQQKQLEVILLCPTGQDAALIASVLASDSLEAKSLNNINELCRTDLSNAGAIILAEEALTYESIDNLNDCLSKQAPWSDIPIILLITGAVRNKQFKLKKLANFVSKGNITLLEKPLGTLTLLTATQVALRARKRQFAMGDLLSAQIDATNIRDEFISIASHELKTPLTSLKLQTELTKRRLIKTDTIAPEKVTKQLEYTIDQVNRLDKLVDDMLDVSRLNAKKLSIHKSMLNLSNLIDELADRFQPQFEAVGCELEKNITPEVIGNWDSYKIEQVVNNLFSNAIRYSPNKKITVGLQKNSDVVILNVKDEGMGIAPENFEKIFERFERINTTRGGLGLGLYITKQIIELHGGSIRVESTVGKGANFIVELPLSAH